jgi:hypothetical protein
MAFAALASLAVLAILPGATSAVDLPVKLVLLPVDQPGSYFDVVMRPGERQTFEVELGNAGASRTTARTYASDVYTIVNGGFGGRLRDTPATGMTVWLGYRGEVVDLGPSERVRRSFTIAVPADAEPGEHISSVVLENDRPIAGGGPVGLDQVIRQAVAVVVTVPGPRHPLVTLGAATHLDVAGRSTVSIAVANPGNVRLKPVVAFTLSDPSGIEISHATFEMDTFFAWTETTIEVPLADRLRPGAYSVGLVLDDDDASAHARAPAIELIVAAPPADEPVAGTGAGLTAVDRLPDDTGSPLWLVGLAGLLGAIAAIAVAAVVVTRRRHRPRSPSTRP